MAPRPSRPGIYPLMHDLLIKDAVIVDGLGGTPYRADLAVAAGGSAGGGADVGAKSRIVDGEGLMLAPGIIDGHTHYDAQITWDPYADPSPALGVTTIVIGNCGFTIAPCKARDRDLTMRNLTHVEGMSLDALRAGIRWDFESFADYLAMIERSGVGPNVAAFVGHSSLRTYVLGEDASRRAATAADVAAMRQLVREAMAAGAGGLATSTNQAHNRPERHAIASRLPHHSRLPRPVTPLGEDRRGIL